MNALEAAQQQQRAADRRGGQFERWVPAGQLLDRYPSFQPGQVRANAVVNAERERQVPAGIWPVAPELVGLLEDRWSRLAPLGPRVAPSRLRTRPRCRTSVYSGYGSAIVAGSISRATGIASPLAQPHTRSSKQDA